MGSAQALRIDAESVALEASVQQCLPVAGLQSETAHV